MKYLFSSSVTVFLLFSAIVFAQSSKSKEGKSLFGDLTARQIGPALMSGRINDLEIHPTNNKILYLVQQGEEYGSQMMEELLSILFLMNIFNPLGQLL